MTAEQSRATKPTGQLPAGVYWIGDLSYVIDDFFEQSIPTVTVLVPSYQEDERVVRTTLLSAALQEHPYLRIVGAAPALHAADRREPVDVDDRDDEVAILVPMADGPPPLLLIP